MATAELAASDEQVAAPSTRVRLHPDNVYFFEKDNLAEAQANKIEKEDTSQAEGFRLYQILKDYKEDDNGNILTPGELHGYVFGKNKVDSLAQFAEARGFSVQLLNPGQRGAKGGPRVSADTLLLMKKIWDKGRYDDVVEFIYENKQYATHFELTPAQRQMVDNYVVVDQAA